MEDGKVIKELKRENAFLRKHLGTWKKLYDRLCDENTRLSKKNDELYGRIHELENGGKVIERVKE